jgi:hypothetical protein
MQVAPKMKDKMLEEFFGKTLSLLKERHPLSQNFLSSMSCNFARDSMCPKHASLSVILAFRLIDYFVLVEDTRSKIHQRNKKEKNAKLCSEKTQSETLNYVSSVLCSRSKT